MSKPRRFRWWLALLLLAAVAAAIAYLGRRPLATAALRQVAHANIGRDAMAELPDGLHLALCGTGSPFPDPTRAGPCSAVIAGKQLYIVDAGEGSARVLSGMGLPAGRIEALLLTHFHSDHIDGLPPFMLQRWSLRTSQQPLPIYGPPGVERVVDGFRAAYTQDYGYRVAHHGEQVMPSGGSGGRGMPFAYPQAGEQVLVLEKDGLKITAFRVNHGPVEPAVGYRFDYQGRSLVISGDTSRTDTIPRVAQGADLLVHEALQPRLVNILETEFAARSMPQLAHIMQDITNYHTTPEEAAALAQQAGVRHLVLNHIVPPLPLRYAYDAFLGDAASRFDGPVTVGEDGMLFSLPTGSTRIEQRRLP